MIFMARSTNFVCMKSVWKIAILVFIIIACNKWENTVHDPNESADSVGDMVIDDEFDWRTSVNVAFYISNAKTGIIKITSTDGTITYHRGYYSGNTDTYYIIVSLPQYVENVLVNGENVSVDSNVIIYSMVDSSTQKSSSVLKASEYSLQFDGKNGYVDIDRAIISDYPFTIAAWVKTDGFADENEDMVILSLADPSKSNRYFGIFIGESEKGKACIRARNTSTKTVSGNTVITNGKWHYVVGVFASSTSRILYVDGQLEAFDDKKVYFSRDADLLTIGRWGDSSPISYFNGNIDEVQVWNTALSNEEIKNLSENLPTGEEATLKAYYKMNTGSGSSIFEEINKTYEGKFNGGVTWSNESVGSDGTGVGDEDDTDGDGIANINDDFPDDDSRTFINSFPASGYGTLAFEDLWPAQGDYDFNDLVVDYQFRSITNSENYVAEIQADFVVRAIGASFENGFGFQFPNTTISSENITVTGYSINNDYITLDNNGLENSQNKPTVIVFDNAFDVLPRPGGESGVNTDPLGTFQVPLDTVKIIITLEPGQYTENEINISNFNPFMIVQMTRGKEIHLPDYAPTALVDQQYFNTLHDDSNSVEGRYYKNENNLPWCINIYESFAYPSEKNEIVDAYLKFSIWAQNNGEEYPDWYLDKEDYRNATLIY